MEKELSNALESILKTLFFFIGKLFKNLYFGIRKLKNIRVWFFFLLSFIGSGGGLIFKTEIFKIDAPIYIQYVLYYILLFFPIVFLICLGAIKDARRGKYDEIFMNIGLRERNGKVPYFIGVNEDGKKLIYTFKTNIPLQEWVKHKDQLETEFDINILKYENGKNKKIVVLTTVPSSFKVSKKINWSDEFIRKEDGAVVLGESALEQIEFNLNKNPHVLVAGTTGSGKSVLLRCVLWQMIKKGCKIFMFDFKGGVEFGIQYEKYGEVVMERQRALQVLTQLVTENDYRLSVFRGMEVKNLFEYNQKTGQNLSRIGVFIDEIAEMLDKTGVSKEEKELIEEITGKLSTLARLSRATGINLIVGTQRPDAKILTGQIKNNLPVRISGRFTDRAASEIVLGNTAAMNLPNIQGRLIFQVGNEEEEFQAYYFDDDTMLFDVDIITGDMLTETPSYKPKKLQEQSNYPEENFNFDFDFKKE